MSICEFCDEAPATAICTFGENTPVCDACQEHVEISSGIISSFIGFLILGVCYSTLGFKAMLHLIVTQPFFLSVYKNLNPRCVLIGCVAVCIYDLSSLSMFCFITLFSYPFITEPLQKIKYNF